MSSSRTVHYLQLNGAIIFISTSGVLGKSITLPPEVAIFWRSALAIPFLVLFLLATKQSLRPCFRWRKPHFLAAVLMGLHWVTYFYALQWSNVAIGMLSLFTFPIISALLEPLFFDLRFQWRHLALGALSLGGIFFLLPSEGLATTHGFAVGLGVFSALCYALRNLILKKTVQNTNGSQMMLIQVMIISLCFLPFLSIKSLAETTHVWPSLLFLALCTTVIGHSLFLHSLAYFSVTTASILSSIQPLYGIVIAYFFLGEIPHWGVYMGGGLILIAVFWESLQASKA